MKKITYVVAFALAVLAYDHVANDSRIAHSIDRNLIDYGRQPVRQAEAAVSFLEFRRN